MSAIFVQTEPDDGSRLGLTLFLALVLHALVILGVGFDIMPGEQTDHIALDVTWVDAPDPSAKPEVAEHIATESQVASGEAQQDQMARSREPEPLLVPLEPDTTAADAAPAVAEPAAPEPVEITTGADETAPVPQRVETPPAPPEPVAQPSAATIMARGLEAARAVPGETQPMLSRATRTLYLDTLSARAAPEAAYLEAWIRKVERIGNLNYPDEARRRSLSGSLVLSVRLNSEGELQDIAIAQSSGEPILDQAAIRIVELAQPFAPFTDSMREQYDHLVITRTWAFRRDRVERVR